jgi:hypothetical protein
VGGPLHRLLPFALISQLPAPTAAQSELVSQGTMHFDEQPEQKL